MQVFYKIAPRLPKMFRDKAAEMKDKDYEKARDPNSAATEEEEDELEEAAAHKNANFITRVSLRLLLPTWKDIIRKLFTPLEIVEPTYKDIITLYRYAPCLLRAAVATGTARWHVTRPRAVDGRCTVPVVVVSGGRRGRGALTQLRLLSSTASRARALCLLVRSTAQLPLWQVRTANARKECEKSASCRKKVTAPTEKELKANPTKADAFRRDQRGIVVKRFDEVPVADVEIVFPDKSVGLKLLDLLTLYGTAIAAFIGGVTAFFGAQLELSYVLSTLGVVGGKLFQVRTPPSRAHPQPFASTSASGRRGRLKHDGAPRADVHKDGGEEGGDDEADGSDCVRHQHGLAGGCHLLRA